MILNPYVRVLWRANDVVQLELGARRVVLQGVSTPALSMLLGRRARGTSAGAVRSPSSMTNAQTPSSMTNAQTPSSMTNAQTPSFMPDGLSTVIKELRLAGFMVSAARPSVPMPPSWLAGEFEAIAATHGDASSTVLRRRATTVVRVDGTSRLAVTIASILSAAGIGHVSVNGTGLARLSHCGPGALALTDEGERFNLAAARRVSEHAPAVNTGPTPSGSTPQLVILADDASPDPDAISQLQQQGQPHLLSSVAADHGVIGPTVLPGRSSCAHCADLHRLDRDDAWSVLAAQLAVVPQRAAGAPISLSTIVAGLTSAQALALLDGDEVTTLNGTLEVRPPDYRIRRRTWDPHRDCRCLG